MSHLTQDVELLSQDVAPRCRTKIRFFSATCFRPVLQQGHNFFWLVFRGGHDYIMIGRILVNIGHPLKEKITKLFVLTKKMSLCWRLESKHTEMYQPASSRKLRNSTRIIHFSRIVQCSKKTGIDVINNTGGWVKIALGFKRALLQKLKSVSEM